MMGSTYSYYNGKIVGGIYDNRLLVKPVKAAISCLPMRLMNFRTTAQNPCCG